MMKIVAISTMLALVSVSAWAQPKQTVWWRTEGAAVIGYDHPRQCALLFYDAKKAVVFTWEPSRVIVQFENTAWNFPKSTMMDVGIEIGDTWLSGGTGHTIPAIADGPILTTILTGDPTAALTKANSVTLRPLSGTVVYPVNRGKLPALFRALGRCRKLLR